MKGISRRVRNKKKDRSEAGGGGGKAGAAGKKKGKKDKKGGKKQAKSKQQHQQQQRQFEDDGSASAPKINSRSTDPHDLARLRALAAQRNRKGRSTLLRTTQQGAQVAMQQQQQQQMQAATNSAAAAAAASSSSSNRPAAAAITAPVRFAAPAPTAMQRQQRHGDALLESFKSRLSGSTFRLMNEQLYTTPSDFARQLLSNESAYKEYHDGYNRQLALWPQQPTDIVIESLRFSKKGRFDTAYQNIESQKKNAQQQGNKSGGAGAGGAAWGGIPIGTVVADFGCGSAGIAKALYTVGDQLAAVAKRKLQQQQKQQQQQQQSADASAPAASSAAAAAIPDRGFVVHSLDLWSDDPSLVTACDMAHTPLEDDSVDIAVFSLSLMSTNWPEYISEAQRVLKKRVGYVAARQAGNTGGGAYFNRNASSGRGGGGGGGRGRGGRGGWNRGGNDDGGAPAAPTSGYGSGTLGSGGILKIVEVRSRMPDPDQFSRLVESLGFEFIWGDVVGDGYFAAFDFECVEKSTRRDPELERSLPQPSDVLIPCLYKRR